MPVTMLETPPEKQPLLLDSHERPAQARPSTHISWYRWFVALGALACLAIVYEPGRGCRHDKKTVPAEGTVGVTDFDEIIPSKKLRWEPCLDDYLCARLQVPMDYNRNATDASHPTVELALIMLPGRNHTETGVFSISPLLLNPGGPGGSGVHLLLVDGALIQQTVGLDQDIVSFDPRGIGASTPLVDCYSFPSGEDGKLSDYDKRQGWFKRLMWKIQTETIGQVNSSDTALKRLDTKVRTEGEMCRLVAELDGENSILRHVSTPAVATDMISIIDAWDAWRAETKQDLTDAVSLDSSLDTKGQLVYWGFSYGTLLGATFASMFPERVGRVVLDAVVDADGYVSPIWDRFLEDTDAAEASFWKFCHQAGSDCALYRSDDTKEDVKNRYHAILEALRAEPVYGINSNFTSPSIVTYDELRKIIFGGLYAPVVAFPAIAILLNYHYTGQYQKLIDALPHLANTASYEPFNDPAKLPLLYQPYDANYAIMCSDKRFPLNDTLAQLQQRFERLAERSHWADVWFTIMLGCDGWTIEAIDPPMRWEPYPPTEAAIQSGREKPVKTAFPLLFVSNTADPVTPLSGGLVMAGKFKDASLIQVDIEGHSSQAQVSECAIETIRAYFTQGAVPEFDGKAGKWQVCPRSEQPWKPFNGTFWLEERIAEFAQPASKSTDVTISYLEEVAERMESWSRLSGAIDAIVRR